MPKTLMWFILIVLSCLVMLVGVLIWIPRLFLTSPSLLEVLNQQTRHHTGYEGSWMALSLDGWKLSGKGYEGRRVMGPYASHLRVEDIHVQIDWRGLFSRRWSIDRVDVGTVEIEFHPSPTHSHSPATEPEPAPPQTSAAFQALLAPFIPFHVQVKEIRTASTTLSLHDGSGRNYQIVKIKSHAIRDDSGAWRASLSNGNLLWPERPAWRLNSGRLQWENNRLDLTESEWLGADAGLIRITGSLIRELAWSPDLKLEAKGVPLTALVPPEWASFSQGTVDGKAIATLQNNRLDIRGHADGNGVRLIGVPALRALQHATGLNQWTELALDTTHLTFHYREEQMQCAPIVLESPGLFRAEGQMDILPDQTLTGAFNLGIRPNVASSLPGSKETVFTLEQNGFHWAQPPIQISGTTSSPREDLSPRLKEALVRAAGEKIQEKVNQGLNLLDSLLRSE